MLSCVEDLLVDISGELWLDFENERRLCGANGKL